MTHLLRGLCVALLCISLPSFAQETSDAVKDELVIATKVAPPFVMKNADGEFEGISIALWKNMADSMGVSYRFEEASLDTLVSGLESGQYDASIAALTVNAQRESLIDFSHPYYTTGLAIAVPKEEGRLMAAISGFFSWKFFAALAGLCLLLLGVGVVIWLVERKGNAEQFGGSTAKGLGSGFWWAAVTMTTVGYGDKAPTTFAGRIVGFIWMFAAIILISSFTAAIATSLTVSQLEGQVQGLDDLPKVKVLTLSNSASAHFLDDRSIGYKKVNSLEDALKSMQSGKADAVVYDKPILQYLLNSGEYGEDLQILPETIDRQDYAIALPTQSPLREQFNTTLLKQIESPEWRDTLENYLGEE